MYTSNQQPLCEPEVSYFGDIPYWNKYHKQSLEFVCKVVCQTFARSKTIVEICDNLPCSHNMPPFEKGYQDDSSLPDN